MESEWDWLESQRYYLKIKENLKRKKELIYELWRIWWTICATGIKRKIR